MIIVQLFLWVYMAKTMVGSEIGKYCAFKQVKKNIESPKLENP